MAGPALSTGFRRPPFFNRRYARMALDAIGRVDS